MHAVERTGRPIRTSYERLDRRAAELGAVVVDAPRQAAIQPQPLEGRDHVLARAPTAYGDVEVPAREQVQQRQGAEVPPAVSSSATKSVLQMSLRSVAGRRCSRCTVMAWRYGRLRRTASPSEVSC